MEKISHPLVKERKGHRQRRKTFVPSNFFSEKDVNNDPCLKTLKYPGDYHIFCLIFAYHFRQKSGIRLSVKFGEISSPLSSCGCVCVGGVRLNKLLSNLKTPCNMDNASLEGQILYNAWQPNECGGIP